ncbi:MAG: GFA family protein [Dongiaceae bacterium]
MADPGFAPLEGGCLCGAVRYRVSLPPLDAGLCHCRMCQRSSGAPFQASAEIPAAGFALLRGAPRAYRSSAAAVRHFCPDCGSQLTFRAAADPSWISVNTPTLDRPEAIPPRRQIWCESRLGWLDGLAALPRHEADGPPL